MIKIIQFIWVCSSISQQLSNIKEWISQCLVETILVQFYSVSKIFIDFLYSQVTKQRQLVWCPILPGLTFLISRDIIILTVAGSHYWAMHSNYIQLTELIMWISHRKEIRKLTFQAQALRRSPSLEPFVGAIHSDEGLALKTSAFESLYGG